MKEQISALIDGESNDLERERILRELHREPELLKAWDRYHIVGTAIRRELDVVVSADLATRVRERIRQERPDAARRFPLSRLWRYYAGAAIAASVATVAIMNLSPLTGSPGASLARSSSGSPAVRTTLAEARPTPPAQQRVLNPYLVHHAEFSSASGINGMSAYARVVGRNNTPAEANVAE